ncbi:hypothetical protein [Candidatus Carsonella ruddii]|uniref:Anthranilate synthase, aminase component n=1 Tax=Carsonella ruddii TaxID=114186 RepID=A0A1U9RRT0_CARRU|nr:hypothetical protein [Candidatus Carsonella ruddii]AQU89614.1 Anthranilate synthase, aminase component [Candidatus Carsonella ruddii]
MKNLEIILEKYFKFKILFEKINLLINIFKVNKDNLIKSIFKIKNNSFKNKVDFLINDNYYINVDYLNYKKYLIFNENYNFYFKNNFYKFESIIKLKKNNIIIYLKNKFFVLSLEENILNLLFFKINYFNYFLKINFTNSFFLKKNISFINNFIFIVKKKESKINFFQDDFNFILFLKKKNSILLNIKKKKFGFFSFLKKEKKIMVFLNKNYLFLKTIEKNSNIIKIKIYFKKGDFFFCFNSKYFFKLKNNKIKYLILNYFVNKKIVVLKKYFYFFKKNEYCFKTIGYI